MTLVLGFLFFWGGWACCSAWNILSKYEGGADAERNNSVCSRNEEWRCKAYWKIQCFQAENQQQSEGREVVR